MTPEQGVTRPQRALVANPVAADPVLQALLRELEDIQAPEQDVRFNRWQTSFLDRLESFLDRIGIEKASAADKAILKNLATFDKALDKVEACVEKGLLKADQNVGVHAQNAVNRLKEECVTMEVRLRKMAPGSNAEIKECGYDKFEMGAVLVRDGFQVYGHIMKQTYRLQALKTSVLEKVVDRQIVDAITYYQRQIQSLCDVMADLGLMDVMQKSRTFAGDLGIVDENLDLAVAHSLHNRPFSKLSRKGSQGDLTDNTEEESHSSLEEVAGEVGRMATSDSVTNTKGIIRDKNTDVAALKAQEAQLETARMAEDDRIRQVEAEKMSQL